MGEGGLAQLRQAGAVEVVPETLEAAMMIAAHALCVGATLVTNDAAFKRIHALTVVDWTK